MKKLGFPSPVTMPYRAESHAVVMSRTGLFSVSSSVAGILSKEALQSQIGGVPVQCHVRNKDMYGRSVSQCTSPGIGDIGHWLVQHGYAIAYRCEPHPATANSV